MKNIAIIGAGIGGILTLQLLKKKLNNVNFILIGNKDIFVFTPRLTEVFSETIQEKYTLKPTGLFNDENVQVIISSINEVNLKERKIYLENKNIIDYDIIVFSQGAKTNFFGSKNLKENSHQFKNYEDVDILKKQIEDNIQKDFENENLNLSIIGGGPTGVELSFALREFLKKKYSNINSKDKIPISLFQSSDSILKGMDSWLIKKTEIMAKENNIEIFTNHRVSEIKDKTLIFKEKDPKKSDITIWVAGIKPNVINTEPKLDLLNDAIPVKNTLQLIDYENAFAIGDCSVIVDKNNRPHPRTAQIAVQQASRLAKNIRLFNDGKKLKPFKFKDRGIFLALGKYNTLALAYFLKFSGILGWLCRDIYYKYIFRKLAKK